MYANKFGLFYNWTFYDLCAACLRTKMTFSERMLGESGWERMLWKLFCLLSFQMCFQGHWMNFPPQKRHFNMGVSACQSPKHFVYLGQSLKHSNWWCFGSQVSMHPTKLLRERKLGSRRGNKLKGPEKPDIKLNLNLRYVNFITLWDDKSAHLSSFMQKISKLCSSSTFHLLQEKYPQNIYLLEENLIKIPQKHNSTIFWWAFPRDWKLANYSLSFKLKIFVTANWHIIKIWCATDEIF